MVPIFEAFPRQVNAVMVGDSITALGQWDDLFPGKRITNFGIPGDTLSGIWNRLPGILKVKPRKVFIMSGVNDLIAGSKAKAVIPIYAKIVDRINSSGAEVFVQSTLLIAVSGIPNVNPEVRALDDALVAICRTIERCTYIDLNTRLAPNGVLAYTIDGVHLSEPGYVIWRDAIYQYMDK
jgi:lysophospholipase L1-like esterase